MMETPTGQKQFDPPKVIISREEVVHSSIVSAFDFSEKRVLVTGGGRGIGLAIVKKFVELNAKVFVLDKDEGLLRDLERSLPTVTGIKVDLRDWHATGKAVESILPIHCLANNAGVAPTKDILDIELQDIDPVFDLNFKAMLRVGQVVARGMIDHGISNGTIVNTGCLGDISGNNSCALYSASKAGVAQLTKIMALEFAPYGIRVNQIRPALVNTEQIKQMPEDFKARIIEPISSRMLFTRLIEPEEIANGVIFLSSSLATMITGTGLTIDSGFEIP